MSVASYLPSTRFSVIVGSIILAGALILGADYVTNPPVPASIQTASTAQGGVDTKWQETLQKIQEQSPFPSLPTPPDAATVAELREEAKTSNVTQTVARTLLINLAEAKSQGLGSDIPTQDALVGQALAQMDEGRGTPQYSSSDLTLSANTQEAQKAYGNGAMAIFNLHSKASYLNTILAVGDAIDTGKGTKLSDLNAIQAEYRALTQEMAALPVPPTLVPLHLQVINDLARVTASYDDMKLVLEDPLRGLAGLQLYDTLTDELSRVFINVAQAFSRNGILFSEEEPGHTWATLLTQAQ